MLFSSTAYIFAFLPLVFLLYFVVFGRLPYKAKIGLLLIASLCFYGWWIPKYLPILIASIIVNYFCGLWLRRRTGDKLLLTAGILLNLFPLFYFKYFDFAMTNISAVVQFCGGSWAFHPLKLALPLGISFFTFQQIAYLVDCCRGGVKKYSFPEYALFVSFWPQLIAGPIVHHKELLPQFEVRRNASLHARHIYMGLIVFILGLAKKMLLADQFGAAADFGWNGDPASLTTASAWLVTVCYSLQLYFDFSGYCDMAWGSAMLFNIRLPLNFTSPYKADSIQDFWRRWHITLSHWLRDYLYFPLGGSRKGLSRTVFNVFFTFLIGGIWHGAGWTFFLWGMIHGAALAVCHLWRKKVSFRMPKPVGWFLTILLVHFAWVFFRAPDISGAVAMIGRMFSPPAADGVRSFAWGLQDSWLLYGMLTWAFIILPLGNSYEIAVRLVQRFHSGKWQIAAGAMCAFLFFLCFLRLVAKNIPQSPFLYFQF